MITIESLSTTAVFVFTFLLIAYFFLKVKDKYSGKDDIGKSLDEISMLLDIGTEKDAKLALKKSQNLMKNTLLLKNQHLFTDAKIKEAIAYITLSEFNNKESNLDTGITILKEIIEKGGKREYKFYWAAALNSLGGAYCTLSKIRNKDELLSNAIDSFKKALTFFGNKRYPIEYAMTQCNLGNAYKEMAEINNSKEHIDLAIVSFEKSLKAFTKEKYPDQNKIIEENLMSLKSIK